MVPGNTDLRDTAAPARRRSWFIEAEEGSYSRLPAWLSRAHWLAAVKSALQSDEGVAVCRNIEIAAHKVLTVAACDAHAADHDTGRNLATAHATVARRTGLSVAAVRRARAVIAQLGFSQAVVRGRRLRLEETRKARAAHGRAQVYAASTRALVMPQGSLVALPTEHQPVTRNVSHSSSALKNSPKRAERRAKASATRRPAMTKSIQQRPSCAKPRPLDVQRLAAALVHGNPATSTPDVSGSRGANHRPLPWLADGRHIGHVCDLIERHGLAGKGWTALQILHQIDLFTLKLRGQLTNVEDRRDPLSFFAWLLKSAIPYGSASPSFIEAQESAERRARQLEEAAVERARRRLIEAQQQEIDAIIASMPRSLPRARRTS